MDTYYENLNASLLFRNKQLTKQLQHYREASVLADCSSDLFLAMSQLLRLHQHPSYGIVRDEEEWTNLFTVIDWFYGNRLSDELDGCCLSGQELKLCYLIRARLCNKTVALLFNITPQSVIKAKQRIKNKLSLTATDSLDEYIRQM